MCVIMFWGNVKRRLLFQGLALSTGYLCWISAIRCDRDTVLGGFWGCSLLCSQKRCHYAQKASVALVNVRLVLAFCLFRVLNQPQFTFGWIVSIVIQFLSYFLFTLLALLIHEKIGFWIVLVWPPGPLTAHPLFSIQKHSKMNLKNINKGYVTWLVLRGIRTHLINKFVLFFYILILLTIVTGYCGLILSHIYLLQEKGQKSFFFFF